MNNKLLQEDLASRQLKTTQELWPLAQLVELSVLVAQLGQFSLSDP